jgi:hypothetical protein
MSHAVQTSTSTPVVTATTFNPFSCEGTFTVFSEGKENKYQVSTVHTFPDLTYAFLSTLIPNSNDLNASKRDRIIQMMNEFADRFSQREFWSAYLILDASKIPGYAGSLVGFWLMFYNNSGSFDMQFSLDKDRLNQGIDTGMWKWKVERLFPHLATKTFSIHNSSGETVGNIPFSETALRCAIRANATVESQFLEASGLHKVEENKTDVCRTCHGQNKLNVYEVAVKTLLKPKMEEASV